MLVLDLSTRKDERLSWPSWLICIADGLPTRVVTHQLQAERRTRKFAGQIPTFYHCATQPGGVTYFLYYNTTVSLSLRHTLQSQTKTTKNLRPVNLHF